MEKTAQCHCGSLRIIASGSRNECICVSLSSVSAPHRSRGPYRLCLPKMPGSDRERQQDLCERDADSGFKIRFQAVWVLHITARDRYSDRCWGWGELVTEPAVSFLPELRQHPSANGNQRILRRQADPSAVPIRHGVNVEPTCAAHRDPVGVGVPVALPEDVAACPFGQPVPRSGFADPDFPPPTLLGMGRCDAHTDPH